MPLQFTNRALPTGVSFWRNCIAGCSTAMAAFPADSSTTMYRSTDDGITWTTHSNPFGTLAAQNVAWNGQYFVATSNDYGNGTAMFAKSADGATWTLGYFPETYGFYADGPTKLAWDQAANRWVAAMMKHGELFTYSSTNNCASWTMTNHFSTNDADTDLNVLMHDGSRFILVARNYYYSMSLGGGADLDSVHSSVDGTTWAKIGYIDRNWTRSDGISFNGAEYLVYGNGGPSRSTDAATWTNLGYERAFGAGALNGVFVYHESPIGGPIRYLSGSNAASLSEATIPGAPIEGIESLAGFSIEPNRLMFRGFDIDYNEYVSILTVDTPAPFWTNLKLATEVQT